MEQAERQDNLEQEDLVVELLQQNVEEEVSVDIEEGRQSDTQNIIRNANNKLLNVMLMVIHFLILP